MTMQSRSVSANRSSSAVHKSNAAKIKKELFSALGKSWDEVLQQLKAKYPNEKALNDPTKFLDVAVSCLVKQGKVVVRNQFKEQIPLEDCSFELFVDPVSKQLKKNEFYAQRQAEKQLSRQKQEEQAAQSRKVLNDQFVAIKQRDDTWAIVRVAKLEKAEYDAYLRKTVNPAFDKQDLHVLYGVRDVYGVESRILTYQETRQLKLV